MRIIFLNRLIIFFLEFSRIVQNLRVFVNFWNEMILKLFENIANLDRLNMWAMIQITWTAASKNARNTSPENAYWRRVERLYRFMSSTYGQTLSSCCLLVGFRHHVSWKDQSQWALPIQTSPCMDTYQVLIQLEHRYVT